jgi:hypothetical protein
MPTRMEMIPADKEGHKTILIFDEMEFDVDLKESFFSQQTMRRVRCRPSRLPSQFTDKKQ